jgi:alpha,alpha-trehalase
VSTEFPPHVLREYALLADGERGALIGPRGDLVWMCAPAWDSDALFSSLIGGRGVYAVGPTTRYVWGGYYEEGSLIWHSRWITDTGVVECREALAFPPDPHTAVILRRVMAGADAAEVRVVLDPRAGFGRDPLEITSRTDGVWAGRAGPLHLRWSAGPGVRRGRDGALTMRLQVDPGTHHDLVLEVSDRPLAERPIAAGPAWDATESAWAREVPTLDHTLAPRDARHAYTVLRGLTSTGGGMVAAATMSLPERAAAGRNYDYRYAWIRDQCYAGQAVAAERPHPLLDDAVAFISARLLDDGPAMKPAYRVDGGAVPDERVLDHLDGYPGGFDKVGNWVNRQFQLDAFGETLLLFAAAARHDHLSSEHWRAVEVGAQAIEARWREPDAGIWELDNQRWAHSRLTCAAGLRAISAHATPGQAARWAQFADAILADVGQDCTHPSGRWQRAPDDPRVDAALLLPAIRGAVDPHDPRSVATLKAVVADLTRDGYTYRFRHDERHLGEAEGSFLLCGLWLARACGQMGWVAHAMASFERNRAACGPPGLLTEEYDVAERQLRGNAPQAFVHALLLECATSLSNLLAAEGTAPVSGESLASAIDGSKLS